MKAVEKLHSTEFKSFCQERDISLAVLFGSQAAGTAREGSDIDLAVWLDKKELLGKGSKPALARRKLMQELISFLKTSKVDLVILNHANSLLKFQVARTGIPVYQAGTERFAEFCSRALREHNDARVFYEASRRYLSRAIGKEG